MIKIGTSTLNQQRITIGATELSRVYVGSNLVWQKPGVPLPPIGYGYLYNFFVLANIAASGWKVPEDVDWTALETYLGTDVSLDIKEAGTAHWQSPNSGATNSSGFTALPEGHRVANLSASPPTCYYTGRTISATWASKTENGTAGYWYRSVFYNSSTGLYRNSAYKQYGFTVRLLKNDSADPGIYTGNDGTTYPTVKIGNQVWTAVNIMETKYNTGANIPIVSDAAAWLALTSGARCTYVA